MIECLLIIKNLDFFLERMMFNKDRLKDLYLYREDLAYADPKILSTDDIIFPSSFIDFIARNYGKPLEANKAKIRNNCYTVDRLDGFNNIWYVKEEWVTIIK